MINNDIIVPVQNTDLLSLYALVLKAAQLPVVKKTAASLGVFEQSINDVAVLCNEPVKSFNFDSTVTSAQVYFIAGSDYQGFTQGGSPVTTSGVTVVNDCATLYRATLATGTLTFAVVGL